MLSFPQSPYMPCPECGASVARGEEQSHACEEERRLDFHLFQLRGEVTEFEAQLGAYLDSPQGRFALWCAERDRRG